MFNFEIHNFVNALVIAIVKNKERNKKKKKIIFTH